MRFKIMVFFMLLVSCSFAQEVKNVKMEEKTANGTVEPFGLIKQRKPIGNFMPDFEQGKDFLIAKIGDEHYTIKPADLAKLIRDISWMSSIPRWNAYISYYKNGLAVYTNAAYVLDINTKNIDPKIFRKIKYHKEIIGDEERYTTKRKGLEKFNESRFSKRKFYFIEHPTNKYLLYFKAYVPVTNIENGVNSNLKNYYPANDYHSPGVKEKFENSIVKKTITYNDCEYYLTIGQDNQKILGGYNVNNQSKFLMPLKIYCKLSVADCANKFDAKTMQLFYGKPTEVYIEGEQKNTTYILEWFEY